MTEAGLPPRKEQEPYDVVMQTRDGGPEAVPSLALVKSHREQILELASALGVSNIRIFGSVARGDATAESDIDLLVDFDRGHRGIDLFRFEREVEELLRYPVEVGTELNELIRDKVASQAVPL